MGKPEDLEYVSLPDHFAVQEIAAELSQEFSRHIQNCREVLSDLKIKHAAIKECAHNIDSLFLDIREFNKLAMQDAFRHILEHEKKLELTHKDVQQLRMQAEPEKENLVKNEEALKNLGRNLAELRVQFGV